MLKEFKEFVIRGNVVDLAVGVIIGAAFGKVVTSLVNDILMPPLGVLVGDIDFSDLKWILKSAGANGKPVTLNYGLFLNNVIGFLIVAWCIFLLVKGINRLREEKVPPAPTEKTCPQCAMTIPLIAKRCGHCTSALA